jgi:hypothetical protein
VNTRAGHTRTASRRRIPPRPRRNSKHLADKTPLAHQKLAIDAESPLKNPSAQHLRGVSGLEHVTRERARLIRSRRQNIPYDAPSQTRDHHGVRLSAAQRVQTVPDPQFKGTGPTAAKILPYPAAIAVAVAIFIIPAQTIIIAATVFTIPAAPSAIIAA